MSDGLRLADRESLQDLATYIRRAKRLDPDGAARVSAHGQVLAVYVSPLHGGGLPDVLALRTFSLEVASDVDAVVPLAALTDRFARSTADPVLAVPPAPAAGVAWAGVSPPRGGWRPLGTVPSELLAAAATSGIAEVASGVPDSAGAAVVGRLRAQVWARPLPATATLETGTHLPAGAAFAAAGLGFLDGTDVAVFAAAVWLRLSTLQGHVLVRRPPMGRPA